MVNLKSFWWQMNHTPNLRRSIKYWMQYFCCQNWKTVTVSCSLQWGTPISLHDIPGKPEIGNLQWIWWENGRGMVQSPAMSDSCLKYKRIVLVLVLNGGWLVTADNVMYIFLFSSLGTFGRLFGLNFILQA